MWGKTKDESSARYYFLNLYYDTSKERCQSYLIRNTLRYKFTQVPEISPPEIDSVNAAEQATNINLATKIAALVNIFKVTFPDAKADLKPWANDMATQELVDPDSIDIGFHFPGWSRSLQSRSILVQVRFYQDPLTQERRVIGIEAAGFDHTGKQWTLSTVETWQFVGDKQPNSEMSEKLKQFCRQVFELFNGPQKV